MHELLQELRLFKLTRNRSKSPVLQNSAQLQIIDLLVQPTFVPGQWNWGYFFLEHMGLKFKRAALPSDEQLKLMCQATPLGTTDYFNTYKNNDVYVVAFTDGACRGKSVQ